MHPRNRHTGRYDMARLKDVCPGLAPFVSRNAYGDDSIDFADPAAVHMLNRALLALYYGIQRWEIPTGYLCPPIPGRADYVHLAADLLGAEAGGQVPRGEKIRVLDIGTGANVIYPMIGRCEYGWRFVASEVDPVALAAAKETVAANHQLRGGIELRLPAAPGHIYQGLIEPGEFFAIALCNPPFHGSLAEAQSGSERKWRNLGRAPLSPQAAPTLNFGGQGGELWCAGGEAAFARRMIEESVTVREQVLWFSTLVSKDANLRGVYDELSRVRATDVRTIDMSQGQKKSRIVAWSFLSAPKRALLMKQVLASSA